MNRNKHYISLIYVLGVMLVILSAVAVSTYAWFTSNQRVYTTTINASTGSDEVKLLLGSSRDTLSSQPCVITEDNMNDQIVLYPVSTADLMTFVAMEGMETNTTFRRITDEDQYYYHGRFYLQAQSDTEKQVTLYLDERDGSLIEQVDRNEVLNASRFALVINQQGEILTVSDENNDQTDQIENTYINGVQITGEKAITLDEDGNPEAVELTSLYLVDACIQQDGETAVYPQYQYTIMTGQVYACDVYFWLEGTDVDCSDALSFQQLDLNISLLGVVG